MSDKEFTVIVSRLAERRIEEIANWYYESSRDHQVSLKWYQGIWKELARLKNGYDHATRLSEGDRIGKNLFQITYGSGKKKTHRAIFNVEGSAIEVLLIRHLSQGEITRQDLEL